MANNNILFNAAYRGALAGVASRWFGALPSVSSAAAFASSVDALISAGSYTSEDASLMTAIAGAIWGDRNPASTDSASYSDIAQKTASLFTTARAQQLPVSGGDNPFVMIAETLGVAPYNSATNLTSDDQWMILWDSSSKRATIFGSGTYETMNTGSSRGIVIAPPTGYEWAAIEDDPVYARGVGTSWLMPGDDAGSGDFSTSSGSTVLLNIVDTETAAGVTYRWSCAFTAYMRVAA